VVGGGSGMVVGGGGGGGGDHWTNQHSLEQLRTFQHHQWISGGDDEVQRVDPQSALSGRTSQSLLEWHAVEARGDQHSSDGTCDCDVDKQERGKSQ
jgi:hypothetical protein